MPQAPNCRRTAAATAAAAVLLSSLAGCAADRAPRAAPTPSRAPANGMRSLTSADTAGSPTTPATPAGNPGGLSDRQLIGQLFMPYAYGSTAHHATAAQRAANRALYGAPTPAAVVRRWHLGGLILIDHNNLDPARPTLSAGNVNSAAQITSLTSGLQRAARANGDPLLLIATDQEGGPVQRIRDGVSPRPPQQAIAHLPPAALTCNYYRLGSQLHRLGVNQDFAPDADVVRTRTGVIGDRSFGPDPRLDGRDVTAAVTGLQDAGVLATIKHWPGHGSTSTDSHKMLAVVREDAGTWRRVDRVPFAMAAHRAAAIMVGHLAVPALDPSGRPATFSPVLTRKLLRHDLGYRGLVVTDSLWMAPARQQGTPGQVALKALRAGNDVLLEPPNLPSSYRALLQAVRTQPRVRALVRNAAGYVLAAKARARRSAAPPC